MSMGAQFVGDLFVLHSYLLPMNPGIPHIYNTSNKDPF